MANTTTTSVNGADITLDGSTDWVLSDETNKTFVILTRIQFNPSAAGDVLIVRDGSASGRQIFNSDSAESAGNVKVLRYTNLRCIPFINVSECSFNAVESVKVIFDWLRTPNFG